MNLDQLRQRIASTRNDIVFEGHVWTVAPLTAAHVMRLDTMQKDMPRDEMGHPVDPANSVAFFASVISMANIDGDRRVLDTDDARVMLMELPYNELLYVGQEILRLNGMASEAKKNDS